MSRGRGPATGVSVGEQHVVTGRRAPDPIEAEINPTKLDTSLLSLLFTPSPFPVYHPDPRRHSWWDPGSRDGGRGGTGGVGPECTGWITV